MADYTAKITDIIKAGTDTRILSLSITGKSFSFKAGQYITLTLEGLEPRPYSIASAPDESGTIELHIKDSGGGGISSHIVKNMVTGDAIAFSGPSGNSIWNNNTDSPLLLIAGGLGIAPIKALLESILKSGFSQPLTLYWGTGKIEDQYLKSHFEALEKQHDNLTFTSVVGKIVGEAATEDTARLSGYNIYLAGSPEMVDATIPMLLDKGAEEHNIHTDNHARSTHAKTGTN